MTEDNNDDDWYKNWVSNWQDDAGYLNDDDDNNDDNNEGLKEEINSNDDDDDNGNSVTEWLTNKAKSFLGDAWEVIEAYCNDWEDTPLDIAANARPRNTYRREIAERKARDEKFFLLT